ALPQTLNPLGKKTGENLRLYLCPDVDIDGSVKTFNFYEKGFTDQLEKVDNKYRISYTEKSTRDDRLWLKRDYEELLREAASSFNLSIEKAALKYGELVISHYSDQNEYEYFPEKGLKKCKQ
ncbi:hypothetical protein, partial [Piscirickettsia litoralis]|uniref:hypothetical protein n=1 Tax=Piscirickettsia litoralis TaxID=1891921 RepID=UPI001F241C7E